MSRLVSPSEGLDVCFRPKYRQERAGDVIDVLRKTAFSFDVAANRVEALVIATGVDARRWASGIAALRVYSRNTWAGPTTGTLIARVENVLVTPDQPGVIFGDNANLHNDIGPVTATTPGGTLFVIPLLAPLGPLLRVSLIFSQGATPASGAQTAELGLTLVGRRA
ncbi:MAG: hypothetical protein U0414_43500 [Polyangiaceae bacterium]